MDRETVLQHYRDSGALLEGHFVLASGLHSPLYLQSARVLMHPDRAEALCAELARRLTARLGEDAVDIVCAPAMGGVIVGYELGRQLRRPAIFAERVDGAFALRRGFALQPGQRVVVAEDVVTTGGSTLQCMDCIRAAGGVPVAAVSLIDRSDGAADVGVPLIALCTLSVPTYAADALPPELAAIPAGKPGSGGLRP
ncbi:MAG: orotate phosphoribosyltransferase [Sneathiellaceae bacterium]